MNLTRNHVRLNDLAGEIDRLDQKVIETERASLELFGSEHDQAVASAAVTETKVELERKLRAYFIESEVVRRADASARRAAA